MIEKQNKIFINKLVDSREGKVRSLLRILELTIYMLFWSHTIEQGFFLGDLIFPGDVVCC